MLQIRLVIVHLAELRLGHRSKQSTQDLSDHSLAVPSERRIQTEQGMNQQSQLKNPPPKKRSPRIAAGGRGWTERSEGNPGDLALRCQVSKFTRSVVSLVPRSNHGQSTNQLSACPVNFIQRPNVPHQNQRFSFGVTISPAGFAVALSFPDHAEADIV